MNRLIKSLGRKQGLWLPSARWSVVVLAAAALLLFPASPAHAAHGINVTATGGLDAQAVLTFFLFDANDVGYYYVDWGDTQQSTTSGFITGTTTVTWNHTYAAAGTYFVQLYRDPTGGGFTADGTPRQVAVPPDTTAPIITISTPADGSTTSSPAPVTVSGTATDPESGIVIMTWSNANSGGSGEVTFTTPPAWSLDASISPGTNHIVITALNGVGITGTGSVDVIYTPGDTTDPVLAITFPPTDPYGTSSSTITITGTASDNVGVSSVDWYSLTTEMGGTATGTTAWSAGPISLYSGTNDILITASDAAGNAATDIVQVVYTSLDIENPTVTITSPTSAATYDTRSSFIPLSGTASDDVGVTGVVWANSANGGSGTAAGTSSWSVAAASLQPGVNVITVTASDAAARSGNDVLTVTYDNGAPSVQITGPTAAVTYTTDTTPLTLTGTASDSETSVATVTWVNDRGGTGTAAGTTSWTAAGITLQPGANAITVTATDQLGNQSADLITVTYDNTDPAVTITSPTGSPSYQTSISPFSLSGTSSDTITSVTGVTWDNSLGGSGNASGTTSWTVPVINLTTGINLITVTAEDEAGNTGTDLVSVTYDSDDPVVTITSPTTAAIYATGSPAIDLSGTADDPTGVVTSVTWINDRGGAGTASGSATWTISSIDLFSGTNVITVTATDNLGNTGSDILTVTYTPADVIDPTISITSPTASPAYTAAATPIALGGTASDNTGVTQVLWASDRGGAGSAIGTNTWTISPVNLSLGTNVLTVTAWDAANNTAQDVLTVDYSPPDLADPTVTITTPAGDPYYTSAGSLVISGTASDDISLSEVRWANDRGGSGTAAGTDSWSATITGLSEGDNRITITAEDWAAKTGTDTVTVVYDPEAPTVTIASPTAEATLDTESATIDISGTATDNLGVVEVLWSNDRGGSGAAAGTANWSVPGIALQEGQNVLTVTATDEVGNSGLDILTVNPAEFLGPSFAGPFFVGRMELQFTVRDPKDPGVVYSEGSPGQATVPRNYDGLGASAIITYSSSGVLRGQWVVDGQVLGIVNQTLLPGRSEAVIPFPEVPGLPTYDAGIHRVEFVIDAPSPAFDEPVISYFVTAQEAPEELPPLTLIYPDDNGLAPLVPGTLQSPNFRWQGLGPGYTYRIALEGRSRSAVVRAFQGGIPPVVIAETPFTHYNLSIFDTGRLLTGSPYTWTVTALQNGRPAAAGGPRNLTFSIPVPVDEGVSIRDLTVSDEGGQQLQAMGQPMDAQPQDQQDEGFTPIVRYLTIEPQPLVIAGVVHNESGEDARNLRVEFTADGDVVDVAFITYLPAGAQEQVTGLYDLPDSDSHNMQVRVIDQGGDQLAATGALIDATPVEGVVDTGDGEGAAGHVIDTMPLAMTGLTSGQGMVIDTASLTMRGMAAGEAMVIDTATLTMRGMAAGEAMVIETAPLTMRGMSSGEAMVIDTAPLTMRGMSSGEAMVIETAPLTMRGMAAGEAMVIETAPLTMRGMSSGEAMVIDTLPMTMTGW